MSSTPTDHPGTARPVLDPALFPETTEHYSDLRAEGVAFTPTPYPYWTTLDYAETTKAARDWRTFESGVPFPEFPFFPPSVPIGSNPPEHSIYRRVLNRFFLPDRMAVLEAGIRQATVDALQPVLEPGTDVEIVGAVTGPLPQIALVRLLGMEEWWQGVLLDKLVKLSQLKDDPMAAGEMLMHLWDDAVTALIDDRVANPRDPDTDTDIMSAVLAMDVNGAPIAPEIPFAVGVQLFAAGGETTSGAMASLFWHVASDPLLQQQLRDDPALIPAAIEEVLRLEPPLHRIGRTATEDVEIGGHRIEAGENVALGFAAANRDAARFERPDEIVLDREQNPHLTFGFGIHQCVGRPLARMELRVALEELLARTEWIEIARDAVRIDRFFTGGFSELWLRSR